MLMTILGIVTQLYIREISQRRQQVAEIRRVKKGRKRLLLERTEYSQKHHLVDRESVDIEEGDFVEATLMREEEKFTLYHCKLILPYRMVVTTIDVPGGITKGSYRQNTVHESTEYLNEEEIAPHFAITTKHSSIRYYAGSTMGNNWEYALVREGNEQAVIQSFVRSKFRHFLLEDVGLWNLHKNGPQPDCREGFQKREEFESAWRSRMETERYGQQCGFSKTEQDILIPHLAAWTEFAAKVRGVDDIKSLRDEVEEYCFYLTGAADHYHCLNPLLPHLDFKSVARVTREKVFAFLAEHESVFPEV